MCICILYIYIYIHMCVYKYSITLCHISVFATRPNIINFPSVSRLSWLAPESCRILVLVWDLAYLTFVFVLQYAAGGWVGISQSSMEDEVKLEPWFGSVTDLQPRGWERGAGQPIGLEQQGKTLIQFSLSSHGEWKVPKTKNELEGGKKIYLKSPSG